MKYIRNGEEHKILGTIQLFTVHKAKIYEDAKYFLSEDRKS